VNIAKLPELLSRRQTRGAIPRLTDTVLEVSAF
jgi:hypothetical protein